MRRAPIGLMAPLVGALLCLFWPLLAVAHRDRQVSSQAFPISTLQQSARQVILAAKPLYHSVNRVLEPLLPLDAVKNMDEKTQILRHMAGVTGTYESVQQLLAHEYSDIQLRAYGLFAVSWLQQQATKEMMRKNKMCLGWLYRRQTDQKLYWQVLREDDFESAMVKLEQDTLFPAVASDKHDRSAMRKLLWRNMARRALRTSYCMSQNLEGENSTDKMEDEDLSKLVTYAADPSRSDVDEMVAVSGEKSVEPFRRAMSEGLLEQAIFNAYLKAKNMPADDLLKFKQGLNNLDQVFKLQVASSVDTPKEILQQAIPNLSEVGYDVLAEGAMDYQAALDCLVESAFSSRGGEEEEDEQPSEGDARCARDFFGEGATDFFDFSKDDVRKELREDVERVWDASMLKQRRETVLLVKKLSKMGADMLKHRSAITTLRFGLLMKKLEKRSESAVPSGADQTKTECENTDKDSPAYLACVILKMEPPLNADDIDREVAANGYDTKDLFTGAFEGKYQLPLHNPEVKKKD